MKTCILFLLSFCIVQGFAQKKSPADYGFRHIQILYQGDTVDLLIKSKKGEEQKPKPLFLFCQGSQPVPLILHSKEVVYGTFPFKPDSLTTYYHLAIISKPAVPLIKDVSTLSDLTYKDSTGSYPKAYSDRNYLDYYVDRNIEVIKYLQKQPWILRSTLVVAGHSEGATIVAKLASVFPRITHLIYSGGNPMGRIASIVTNSRRQETDSSRQAEQDIEEWKAIVNNPTASDATKGDPHKTTYGFSIPPITYLQKITIPVFVSFGTNDVAAPFNDYLQLDMIRQHKNNFTFKGYIGTEHNFFGLNPDGSTNYDAFNWDRVALDWLHWLLQTNAVR
jgi:pimeloyl-ACP methyl ester carboxylesterase